MADVEGADASVSTGIAKINQLKNHLKFQCKGVVLAETHTLGRQMRRLLGASNFYIFKFKLLFTKYILVFTIHQYTLFRSSSSK